VSREHKLLHSKAYDYKCITVGRGVPGWSAYCHGASDIPYGQSSTGNEGDRGR